MRRVNFAAKFLADTTLPGVKAMVQRLKAQGTLSPEAFVDACLDLLGTLEVNASTRHELLDYVREGGELGWQTAEVCRESERRVGILLALIAASREYQFA